MLTLCGSSGSQVAIKDVETLANTYWEYKLSENPWWVTKLGRPGYDDKVEDWNWDAFNRRIVSERTILNLITEREHVVGFVNCWLTNDTYCNLAYCLATGNP